MSGLARRGEYRFITLTSALKCSKEELHADFRALVMRMRRRGLMDAYFQVVEQTKAGLLHIHMIYRGGYLSQALLSYWWQKIHGAPIVYIQRVDDARRAVGRYVVKYVTKEALSRWSCSWSWVWRGFCSDWSELKRYARERGWQIARTLRTWRWFVRGGDRQLMLNYLAGFGSMGY